MKEERILLSSDGPDRNVLKLKPPMVFTIVNADHFVATLDQILDEIKESGLIIDNKSPEFITTDLEVEGKKMKFVCGDIEVSLHRNKPKIIVKF